MRKGTTTNNFNSPFIIKKLNTGVNALKNGKSAGVDNICVEQIKYFGPSAIKWTLDLFTFCQETFQIPKPSRKAQSHQRAIA